MAKRTAKPQEAPATKAVSEAIDDYLKAIFEL